MKLATRVVLPLALIASMVLTTAVPAQAAVVPALVRDDPARTEYAPAATGSYVAWSDITFAGVVLGMPRAGGSVFAIQAPNTQGLDSSPVTGGTDQIIYQQINAAQTKSDLFFYDLAGRVRTKLPKKVDSKYWEWSGVASAQYVLFDRRVAKWSYMLLYNRSTHSLKTVARFKTKCYWCFTPTWVGALHAVYNKCSAFTGACTPNVLTIGGSVAAVPMAGSPVSAYGASLDESSGNLYFIKSSLYCGIFVSLERANIASLGSQTDLYDSPSGFDLESTSIAPDAVSGIDLLFADFDCMGQDSGIYEIDQVDLLP